MSHVTLFYTVTFIIWLCIITISSLKLPNLDTQTRQNIMYLVCYPHCVYLSQFVPSQLIENWAGCLLQGCKASQTTHNTLHVTAEASLSILILTKSIDGELSRLPFIGKQTRPNNTQHIAHDFQSQSPSIPIWDLSKLPFIRTQIKPNNLQHIVHDCAQVSLPIPILTKWIGWELTKLP